MSKEEILSYFYTTMTFVARQERLEGAVRSVALSRPEADPRPRRRQDRQGQGRGRREADAAPGAQARRGRAQGDPGRHARTWSAATSPSTSINEQTGEIYAEAGDELTEQLLDAIEEGKIAELPVLAVDHVSVGPYIRNTLMIDKNAAREDALIDIYRVMRPGEPPTLETAETLFNSLFFDGERYDLSAVGRVKMNSRLSTPDRGHRAHAAQGRHPRHPQGAGRAEGRPRRDRRHRSSRQPPRALGRRADGEPVPRRPAAHGARDPRAHELGRDRHGDAARPHQRQAGGGGGARVLRLLAAVAVHGPDQPALRDHPQAAALGAGAGRPDARARRLRGARRASDPLRPHLPDRDAGRAEYRPHQQPRDLCAGQPVRLHRESRIAASSTAR